MKALLIILGAIFFVNSAAICDPATISYCNYFGEYFSGAHYNTTIEIETDSVESILNTLSSKYNSEKPNNKLESNMVLIGYGEENLPTSYFAATKNLANVNTLKTVLPTIPEKKPKAQWFVLFINSYYSHYAEPNAEPHHWSSPFSFINNAGKAVTYF